MKKLADFPAYVAAKNKLAELQKALADLRTEREMIASQLLAAHGGVDVQAQALLKDEFVDMTTLSEQLGEIDRSIQLHAKAVELQRSEVEKARSFASADICQLARPEFVKHIRKILESLRQACEANEAVQKLRDDLEDAGIETGSIPVCTLSAFGSWDNPQRFGRAAAYRSWIEQNFPEVTQVK